MIFPKNINKKMQDQHSLAGDNALRLGFTVFVLSNLVAFFIISWINTTFLTGDFLLSILLLVIFNFTVGIFVFRFFIFDENTKMREMQNSEGDSFIKYVKVRKDVEHKIPIKGKGEVSATEFINGSLAFTIEFKFGSNNDTLARSTRNLLEELFRTAFNYKMEVRTCITSEDFSRSTEYAAYSNVINRVPSVKLRNALILISEAIMEKHKDKGNVNNIYMTVHSKANYQRADLEDVLHNFLKIIEGSISAFRSVHFLNNEELLEFFTIFYGVDAIDFTTAQAVELSKDIQDTFSSMVKVFSYETGDGNSFVSKDANSISLHEKSLN